MRGRALAAWALATLALGAATAAAQDVPTLTGRVVDRAGMLSPATEAALTARLAAHEDSTSNQVVVLTVPSLEGEAIEPYATRVFRAWGLGQAGRDNGVLLLVARDDRELRIEVGYGLEGDLTDATSGTIIRRVIVPRFRDGDVDGGVLAGVDAILGAIEGTYEPPETSGVSFNGEPAEDTPLLGRLVFALLFGGLPLVATAVPVLSGGGTGVEGDVGAGCVGLFAGLFVGFALVFVLVSGWGILVGLVAVPLAYVTLNRWLEAHPRWGPVRRHNRAKRAAFREARRRGETSVVVGGRTYSVPVPSSGGGSGGGGFSGGGGSSGGGGASGSW